MQNSATMAPPQWTYGIHLTPTPESRIRETSTPPLRNATSFTYPPTPPSVPNWMGMNTWSTKPDDYGLFKLKNIRRDLNDLHFSPMPNRRVSPEPRMDTPPNSQPMEIPRMTNGGLCKRRLSAGSDSSSGSDERRKNLTFIMEECCDNIDVKITCKCCGENVPFTLLSSPTSPQEQAPTSRPRMIPVATSQLGFCRFCQVNGETPAVFTSHSLRSSEGKVTCPTLREYNCPICNNGGGDYAHTVKYCPYARERFTKGTTG